METSGQTRRFPKLLTVSWWFVYLPLLALEARLLYEETWLTYTRGEQMIGFTMAHKFPELLLLGFFGWAGCLIWCSIALVVIVRRKHELPLVGRIQLTFAAVTLLLPFVPIDRLVLRLR